MERISYGLEDDDGRGDPMRVAFRKLENAILDLEYENQRLRSRVETLESRFRIHIRGPFAEED